MRSIVFVGLGLAVVLAGCFKRAEKPVADLLDAEQQDVMIEYLKDKTLSLTGDRDHFVQTGDIQSVRFGDSAEATSGGLWEQDVTIFLHTDEANFAVGGRVQYRVVDGAHELTGFGVTSVEER